MRRDREVTFPKTLDSSKGFAKHKEIKMEKITKNFKLVGVDDQNALCLYAVFMRRDRWFSKRERDRETDKHRGRDREETKILA